MMKYLTLFFALGFFTIHVFAQTVSGVSTPQHIVVDSKDNVFATLKYGIVKITPDGTVTNISSSLYLASILYEHLD